eukprot:355362-Chlamydomonas_euryale.AAC.1
MPLPTPDSPRLDCGLWQGLWEASRAPRKRQQHRVASVLAGGRCRMSVRGDMFHRPLGVSVPGSLQQLMGFSAGWPAPADGRHGRRAVAAVRSSVQWASVLDRRQCRIGLRGGARRALKSILESTSSSISPTTALLRHDTAG